MDTEPCMFVFPPIVQNELVKTASGLIVEQYNVKMGFQSKTLAAILVIRPAI